MANRRVSLKGRGAEIFFGDVPLAGAQVSEPKSDDAPPPPVIETNLASMPAEPQPTKRATNKASKQASNNASMREPEEETPWLANRETPEPIRAEVLEAVWNQLLEQGTLGNTFRYTEQELSALTDAVYELGKGGAKLTKQDVARLGLNAILWDYQERGEESLLAQFAARRKRLLRAR
jgi:hypothetical protein